jgi:ligand-binding sensor domain-containing protein
VLPQQAGQPPPEDRRVSPVTVEGALERYPAADAMRSLVLVDEGLQHFRYTSAAITPMEQEVFFGTDGRGLLQYETGTARFEDLPFGLPGDDVGSVVSAPEGVWVGINGTNGHAAFALVGNDLQRFVFTEEKSANRFPFATIHDLAQRNDEAWAATDRGLARVAAGSVDLIEVIQGAATSDAYAVVCTAAGVWAGTAGGLVFVARDALGASRLVWESGPVTALALEGDSLWVGGVDGLALLVLGGGEEQADTAVAGWFVPQDVARQPILRDPVVALAAGSGHAVAATRERVVWRPREPDWSREVPVSGHLGEIIDLAADSDGVWIGGTVGLGYFDFASGAYRTVTGAGDLPGAVRGIAAGPEYVWLATDGGLVRFAKNTLVP